MNPNLKPWKPGQSGNPGGRPAALPPEIRIERKKNQAALIQLVAKYLCMTDEQAMARISGPDVNQLEGIIQGMIGKAKEGDVPSAKYLLELMVGEIPKSDYDEFTEDDLRILIRVKEVLEDQKRINEAVGDGTESPKRGKGSKQKPKERGAQT